MSMLHLTALCLCIAGINLDVVETTMCGDGWVVHTSTATCLQTRRQQLPAGGVYRQKDWNLCRRTSGIQGIPGNIVIFTETMEPFLRDYLRFVNVSAAVIDLRDQVYIIRSLQHIREPYNALTYFVPGNSIPFTQNPPQNDTVICQVLAGPREPPVCPRDVKLVSTSDRNITLSWSPGQLGRQVAVNVLVQICDGVALSCKYFTTRSFTDVSLFQSKDYIVTGLQPNTKYTLTVQIVNDKYETQNCSVDLPVSTREDIDPAVAMSRTEQGQESTVAIIGLSTALAISLGVHAMLAVLLVIYVRRAKKGESSATDKIASKIVKPKIQLKPKIKPEIKLEVHKGRDTSSGLCRDGKEQPPHEYEKTIVYEDNHIYEM